MATTPLTDTNKADFSAIYTQPDPRAYYSTLKALDYEIPQRAMSVVESVLTAMPARAGGHTALDVCCSYGVNAALLAHGLSFHELAEHYAICDADGVTADELRARDRTLVASRPPRPGLTMLGLDAAAPAIAYAVSTRLMSNGWAENLEDADPSTEFANGLKDVDLIVSTGGVGYVGRSTFERILGAVDRPDELWLAIFVLRVFDYSEIVGLLTEYGMRTEQLENMTFPQRRFASETEQQAAIEDVQKRGLDATGKEASGWFYADCFISRPSAFAATPIAELLGS